MLHQKQLDNTEHEQNLANNLHPKQLPRCSPNHGYLQQFHRRMLHISWQLVQVIQQLFTAQKSKRLLATQ